jgi:hypothetical protein
VLPIKYLGLPLGAPYKSVTIRNGIVEKNGKAFGRLEATIFVEGREFYVDQKYLVQFTHLFIYLCFPFLWVWRIRLRNCKEIFYGEVSRRSLNSI